MNIVHDSPSIRAGPETALFQKLKDCELSDKVFVLKGRHQQVTWQLLSKFLFYYSSNCGFLMLCYSRVIAMDARYYHRAFAMPPKHDCAFCEEL